MKFLALLTIHKTAAQEPPQKRHDRATERLARDTARRVHEARALEQTDVGGGHEIARVHRQAEVRREGDAREPRGPVGRVAVPERGEVGA